MTKEEQMIPFEEISARWKKDPEFMAYYNALDAEFAVYEAMIIAAKEKGMTQKKLAKKMKTSESAISRLFSMKNHNLPSWSTITKFAEAIGKRPVLTFVDA